jgi:hypothetical protein
MIKPCNQNNNLLRQSILTFTLSDPLAFFSHFLSQSRAKPIIGLMFFGNQC